MSLGTSEAIYSKAPALDPEQAARAAEYRRQAQEAIKAEIQRNQERRRQTVDTLGRPIGSIAIPPESKPLE